MKNEVLLRRALDLLPVLNETRVGALGAVLLSRDEAGRITAGPPEDYRQKPMKKGDSLILDFGNHQVGYFSLELGTEGSHADAPVWLKLHFAENPAELFEDASKYRGWICSSWIEIEQIHVDILPGAVQLPRRYACRYLKVEILDISSKFSLLIKNAVCRAVSSADDRNLLPYTHENPLYRKLDQIACRTLRSCMQSVFEDGPKRDRRLWMGDLRIQALVNYETYQNYDLVRECLYLFAALPTDSGQIGACLFLEPEPEVDDVVMLDYSLFFVAALRDYYRATGDRKTLEDLWPTALSQLYLSEAVLTDQDLIRDSDEQGWCFIDWNLELNKQAAAQGVFLYTLRAGMELAGILEETDIRGKLEMLYESCRNAANIWLWDMDRACYVSGQERQVSVASQVWMILGGAVEGAGAASLLKRVMSMDNAVRMVSPYMVHHYVEALILAGEEDAAISYLCGYWGQMADQGADTFWELFNPENPHESPYGGTIVNSYCHAWSCGPAYFLRKYRPR